MVAIGLGFFGPAQGTRKKPGTKSGPAHIVLGRAWPEARIELGFFQFLTRGLARARPEKYWA
jgi:hypothetical protein